MPVEEETTEHEANVGGSKRKEGEERKGICKVPYDVSDQKQRKKERQFYRRGWLITFDTN
jgi:hypothetical protein